MTANKDTQFLKSPVSKKEAIELATKYGGVSYVPEDQANKSTDGTFNTNSDTLYPSEKATKTYITSVAATKQDVDADLTTIAGLTPADDDFLQRKAGAWANRTPAQAKADLVLVKGDVGLGDVDNTSDADKPISDATQDALDLKAPLDSPDFTGSPTAPTQSAVDNSTKLATTAYVDAGNLRHYSATANGTPITIDPASGKVQTFTLTANTTFTLASAPAAGVANEVIIKIIQDATGGWTPTFANLTWDTGLTPTFDTTANSVSTIQFIGTEDGWRGYVGSSAEIALAALSLYIYQTDSNGYLQVLEQEAVNLTSNLTKTTLSKDLATTDATITTIYTLPVPTDKTIAFKATFVARRTGGTSGANGDGGSYTIEGSVINASGTVTRNITITSFNLGAFTGAVTAPVLGTDLLLRCQGVTNYNVAWGVILDYLTISS